MPDVTQRLSSRTGMRIRLHWQILGALILAVAFAFGLRAVTGGMTGAEEPPWLAAQFLELCRLLGTVFLNALKMVIVPLIVSSVISGIAGLGGVDGFGRLGLKTLAFYVGSSTLAILIGLTLVNAIRPGLKDGQPSAAIREAIQMEEIRQAADVGDARIAEAASKDLRTLGDIFTRMFPQNVIAAAANDGQMLGLIVFSILFGVAMTRLPVDRMKPLLGSVEGVFDVMLLLTRGIMACAPVGVFALLVPVLADTGFDLIQQLGAYFVTVLLALLVHALVALPLVLWLVGGVHPFRHYKAMATALLTAFSTASSSATLPVTMRCVRENAGVSDRISGFVLPLGATVNMDGTALYECVAVLFVAQVMGVEMGLVQQTLVVVLALLTSIGVAGIPSASLVAILIILQSSGIPGATAAVGVLLAVDRLLDMTRTAVNVFSDSCAAVVIARSEGEADVLAGRPGTVRS